MKTKRMLAVMLAVVLMMSLLIACGNKGGSAGDPNAGVYKLDSVMGIFMDEFAAMAEESGAEADDIAALQAAKMELKDGGQAVLDFDGTTYIGEWKLEGETLTFTSDGEEMKGTLKDGVITITAEGVEMTFKKSGEGKNDSKGSTAETVTEAPTEDPAVGVYKLDTAMGMSLAEFAEMADMSEAEAADMMEIELKDGGKFSMTVDGETGEGEWKLDGEKLTLTVDGEAQEATLKDGVITMEEEGMSVTFKK